MIARTIAIMAALAALVALWVGYDQLRQLRGTPFWDYRYLVYAVAAFLGLSALERVVGWVKTKIDGEDDAH